MKNLFTISPADIGKGGNILMAWHPQSLFFAFNPGTTTVFIFNRNGTELTSFSLPNRCTCLEWDKDGKNLAAHAQGQSSVILFNITDRTQNKVDCGAPVSFFKWSLYSEYLACGTETGNLIIYNKSLNKKIPVLGVTQKALTCGDFNERNQLAVGSADKRVIVFNVSNGTPKVQKSFVLAYPISSIEWGDIVGADRSVPQSNQRSLLIFGPPSNLSILENCEKENEILLTQTFGQLRQVRWHGNGYILVVFESGHFLVVSSHPKEISKVIVHHNLFQQRFLSLAIPKQFESSQVSASNQSSKSNDSATLLAVSGDTTVKFLHADTFKEAEEEQIQFGTMGYGSPLTVMWSPDGQILLVSTSGGSVVGFIASFPALNATCGNMLAYRSSLREITVVDVAKWSTNTGPDAKPTDSVIVTVEVEPSLLCVGPSHIAVAMNNHAWIYHFGSVASNPDLHPSLIFEKDYSGSISSMYLNKTHFAVLVDRRVSVIQLTPTEQPDQLSSNMLPFPRSADGSNPLSDEHSRGLHVFPQRGAAGEITALAMTDDFLVYGMNDGSIVFYSLADWGEINNFRMPRPLQSVTPNFLGTRVICFDADSHGFVYSPITDAILPFPQTDNNTVFSDTVLVDQSDANVFVVKTAQRQEVTTLVISPDRYEGPAVTSAGVTPIPDYMKVVAIYAGYLYLQSPTGDIYREQLHTHHHLILATKAFHTAASTNSASSGGNGQAILNSTMQLSQEIATRSYQQCMKLYRVHDAWNMIPRVNDRKILEQYAMTCLHLFNIDLAIRAYRLLGNIAMVKTLQRLENCDDKNLLSGYIALIHNDKDKAQNFFIRSSNPIAALDMRCDAMQWEQALQLASRLARERKAGISFEYALQLEQHGDYQKAQQHFRQGLTGGQDERQDELCYGGIARTSIRTGDVRKGIDQAIQINKPWICRECASLLEGMKLLDDAALLYDHAGMTEHAIELLFAKRRFKAAEPLMKKVDSPILHLQYGRAMESEGKLDEAIEHYRISNDLASVVRLYIQKNDLQSAMEVVKSTHSSEAAMLLSNHCVKNSLFNDAIYCLVVARCYNDAFELARTHNCIDNLCEVLESAERAYRVRVKADEDEKRRVERQKQRKKEQQRQRAGWLADADDDQSNSNIEDLEKEEQGEEGYGENMGGQVKAIGHDDSIPPEEFTKLGKYFEDQKDFIRAARMCDLGRKYHRAVTLYLQVGTRESITDAIAIVEKANNSIITGHIQDFLSEGGLIRETADDGTVTTRRAQILPIDFFRFYMATGDTTRAAKSAVSVALKEMSSKNYTGARDFLFQTQRDLRDREVDVPTNIIRLLNLTHSYHVAKKWIQRKNDPLAARLLLRCAKNQSKFEGNIVPILVTTVMECHFAGMRKSALEFASQLMQPDLYKDIPEKRRHPIEQIVLRTPKDVTDPPEQLTPCPACNVQIPSSQLICTSCQTILPMCIVSGMHMVMHEYAECPACHMPFNISIARTYFQTERTCPLCGAPINTAELSIVIRPTYPVGRKSDADDDEEDEDAKRERAKLIEEEKRRSEQAAADEKAKLDRAAEEERRRAEADAEAERAGEAEREKQRKKEEEELDAMDQNDDEDTPGDHRPSPISPPPSQFAGPQPKIQPPVTPGGTVTGGPDDFNGEEEAYEEGEEYIEEEGEGDEFPNEPAGNENSGMGGGGGRMPWISSSSSSYGNETYNGGGGGGEEEGFDDGEEYYEEGEEQYDENGGKHSQSGLPDPFADFIAKGGHI